MFLWRVVIISIKINLEINREIRDKELELKIIGFKPLIRIFGKIKFQNLGLPEDTLIDTGAHISLIPFQLWKDLDVRVIAQHHMGGVVPEKNIPVNVGYIKAKIVDEEENSTDEIEFLSYLALTNKVPLILGMRDLLERFDIHILFSEDKTYLEKKDND